jgi:anti-sigma regulatory factor (Ser/Thr protein kinase)
MPLDTAGLVVAELAANAVLHGRVSGRDFLLGLALTTTAAGETLRIEVTDARAERIPAAIRQDAGPEQESGRGLLLVEALADRWGVMRDPASCTKTVWAELTLRH